MLRPSPRLQLAPRRHLFVLSVLVLAGAIWPSRGDGTEAGVGALISLDMDPTVAGVQDAGTVPQGSPIVIDVVISNAPATGAFEFELVFDSFVLSFEGWSEGPFLGSTQRETSCSDIVLEHSLHVVCGTLGPSPPGASGGGVLATLTFSHLLTGTTCPQIIDAETTTIFGDPLPTDYESGCITVTPVDSDGDGWLDSVDNCPDVANAGQQNGDGRPLGNGPGVSGDDGTVPDGDSAGDACDLDDDNDGLADIADSNPLGACATFAGWTDGHPSPARADMTWSDGTMLSMDTDGDMVTDGAECAQGTNPRSASMSDRLACHGPLGGVDTDDDGLLDAWEVCKWGTLASGAGSADTDGDGLGDCTEALDVNGNELVTLGDSQIILQVAFGMIAPDWTFDLNGNGQISPADASLVRRVFFGLDACA
jgi:hypothetical protein